MFFVFDSVHDSTQAQHCKAEACFNKEPVAHPKLASRPACTCCVSKCWPWMQVLTLAHQLDPSILRRGVSAGLWDDLRHLLDMLPQQDAEGDPRLGMIASQRGPSILAADAAVTAVEVRLRCTLGWCDP